MASTMVVPTGRLEVEYVALLPVPTEPVPRSVVDVQEVVQE
jgi:hypothetical protein